MLDDRQQSCLEVGEADRTTRRTLEARGQRRQRGEVCLRPGAETVQLLHGAVYMFSEPSARYRNPSQPCRSVFGAFPVNACSDLLTTRRSDRAFGRRDLGRRGRKSRKRACSAGDCCYTIFSILLEAAASPAYRVSHEPTTFRTLPLRSLSLLRRGGLRP